jgi:hypothetical protein
MKSQQQKPQFISVQKRIAKIVREHDIYFSKESEDAILQQLKGRHPPNSELVELVLSHTEGSVNRCVECRCDMGLCNPRQLCGKYMCSTNQDM